MTPLGSPSCGPSDIREAADVAQPLFITVVVPVRNEARFIQCILARLVSQDYAPGRFEILVIDGQSTDGTPELVAQFAAQHQNVRLFTNPKRLSSAARNIGIQNAQGDVVVLVDGHCELDDDQYLRKLASAFDRSGADCIGRPQPLDVTGATTLQRAIAAARSSRLGHHPDSYIYSSTEAFVPAHSVAVAYRRAVFEQVGYFDEQYDACEDVELNYRIDRAGLRCFFTPQVAVRYAPRATLGGLFHQLVRYGRGRVRLLRKHPETFSFKSFLPVMFLVGCVAGFGIMWLSSWLAAAYLTTLAVYGAILLSVSATIVVRQRDPAMFPWLPLVFLSVHFGSGFGVLLEALRPVRPRADEQATWTEAKRSVRGTDIQPQRQTTT